MWYTYCRSQLQHYHEVNEMVVCARRSARDLVKQLVSSSTSHEMVRQFIQTTQVVTSFGLGSRARRDILVT